MSAPKIVIEIRGGSLYAVYAEQAVDLVLVDYDEDPRHGASVEVIPEAFENMPAATRRLAVDAKERAK